MNKAQKRVLKAKMNNVLNVGAQMSNICFNLAQDDSQKDHVRKIFDLCRRNWDQFSAEAHQELDKL
jgi:hypothetical protein